MDLDSHRKQYGRFPLERRDWPVDAGAFSRFAAMGPKPSGAAALMWNDRREILLLQHTPQPGWSDEWATPGGFAEPGESPDACAIRETKEETGLDLRITGLTKVIVCYVTSDDRTVPYTFFQFEGEAAGTPRPGEGIAQVAWLDRLPPEMHFRSDYEEPWLRRRPVL